MVVGGGRRRRRTPLCAARAGVAGARVARAPLHCSRERGTLVCVASACRARPSALRARAEAHARGTRAWHVRTARPHGHMSRARGVYTNTWHVTLYTTLAARAKRSRGRTCVLAEQLRHSAVAGRHVTRASARSRLCPVVPERLALRAPLTIKVVCPSLCIMALSLHLVSAGHRPVRRCSNIPRFCL